MSKSEEQLDKSKALNKLSIDLANYDKAAVSNPKFESYYLGRVEATKAEMAALQGGTK
tara:strand:- start:32 stop:205 length:174 start_codon:yes stop_codon:yes gene_type:complete